MRKSKAYSDSGGNGEIILLLHGFPASHTYWRSTSRFFSKRGYRVIALDQLGFGHAPMPGNIEYTYTDHLAYIEGILKTLKINSPIIIIGHSMGGLVGARFAALHPGLVKKLVLLHPPLYDSRQQAHDTIYGTSKLYRFVLSSPLRNIAWWLLRPLSLFIVGKHTARSRELSFKNIVLSGEIFEDLDNIKSKTLLLVGAHDRPQYLANLKIHQLSKLVTLRMANVGHHSVILHKKLVRKIILDFLQTG